MSPYTDLPGDANIGAGEWVRYKVGALKRSRNRMYNIRNNSINNEAHKNASDTRLRFDKLTAQS